MMGPGFVEGIAESLFFLGVALFVAGALFATALIFGLPWLWEILKPLLHALTAA